MDETIKLDDRWVDIIVPVYNAAPDLDACLRSVRENTTGLFRIILIDDGSTDPAIWPLIEKWRTRFSDILVLSNEQNLGFTKTVNHGLILSDKDVVLLNSDTIVTAGWLVALKRCALSHEKVGTVTPFSNNAEICSYPLFCVNTPWLPEKNPEDIRMALERAAVPTYPQIPTGVGFCFYIKRSVLDAVGVFDEVFGAGYGEENDFCLRTQKAGFRNVLCDDAFVVHTGGRSFAGRKMELSERNMPILISKHPEYLEIIREYISQDPLYALREAARLEEKKALEPRGILHIVHTHGGGTESHVRQLIVNMEEGRHYLAMVNGDEWRIEIEPGIGEPPTRALNLRRRQEESWTEFIAHVYATLGITFVHVHNLSSCREGILTALPELPVDYGYTVHDLSFACPTITFLNQESRFCGAEIRAEICQRCLNQQPAFAGVDIANWRAEHGKWIARAAFVIAPSQWAAETFRQYFPDTAVTVIAHGSLLEKRRPHNLRVTLLSEAAIPTVAVIGAVGPDKGARRLERLVELAQTMDASIRFVLIGYLDRQHGPWESQDGRFIVHGRYDPLDLDALLSHYQVSFVLYPSVCPESFSYTLSEIWQAGRPALVPPIGALKERMAREQGGWVMTDAEWQDEALMLQRLLLLLDPANNAELEEKAVRARNVPVMTLCEMVQTTLGSYPSTTPLLPGREKLEPFAAIRVRDALGYIDWQPRQELLTQSNVCAATDEKSASFAVSGLQRFIQTGLGRIVYRATPKIVIRCIKYILRER